MVKEQIEPELLLPNLNPILAPEEREPNTEFQQEIAQMLQEPALQIALVRLGTQRQEIEVVGIFGDLLRQVGLRRRQSAIEIRDGLSLPAVEPGFDLQDQNRSEERRVGKECRSRW